MLIDDNVRKCVQFLQYQSGRGMLLAGTSFMVSFIEDGESFGYLVTAKHVIDRIREKASDGRVYVRVNVIGQSFEEVSTNVIDWWFHPTDSSTDIAVTIWPSEDRFDQLSYPICQSAATPEVIGQLGIGVGDEVFLVGLFHMHHGKKRNIPIIRLGNIAAMPEEPVELGHGSSMDAYLVEMRSIGGLSGSPVFIPVGGRAGSQFVRSGTKRGEHHSFYLLGLMHGHWNTELPAIDESTSETSGEPLNTGIGIVVPVTKILETIRQERFAQIRKDESQRTKSKNGPTPD
jgi:hypothetical protein